MDDVVDPQIRSRAVGAALGTEPFDLLLAGGTVVGDPELFGPGAALVRSDALVRLTISSVTPPALLSAYRSAEMTRATPGE